MKQKLVTTIVLALSASAAMAATTVTIANVKLTAPASSLLITNETGTVYAGGSWGVGVFNPTTDWSGSAASILSAFNQNGSSVSFAASAGVIGALGGASVTNASTPTTVSGPFVGNPIYVLIGNAGTLAGSTDFIVVNSGVNWAPEIEGVGGTSSALLQDGTVLRGISTVVNGGVGPTAQFNGQAGVTFGVIPEPSAALLGALGALGLLRRRRN